MQISKVLFGRVSLILSAEELMLQHISLSLSVCWEEVLDPKHYVLRAQSGVYNVNLASL